MGPRVEDQFKGNLFVLPGGRETHDSKKAGTHPQHRLWPRRRRASARVALCGVKAGIIAFTKSLAVELAPYDITVNAVCPGATDTPMSRAGSTAEEFKKRGDSSVTGWVDEKEEIVGLTRYLLSDATKYVTGQTFSCAAEVAPTVSCRDGFQTRPYKIHVQWELVSSEILIRSNC
mgnify:CR=1 FL=1